MVEEKNTRELEEIAFKEGADLFGVARVENLETPFLSPGEKENLTFGISLGVRLLDRVLEGIKDKPTLLYFHHYRQVNFLLDRLALKLASWIQKRGWETLPLPASQTVDWEKQRGHLSHKEVAYLAGLGWIGRNNLLVNPKYGARIRLVTLLTNLPLKSGKPMEGDCGKCQACLELCPAGAIGEKKEEFDYFACFEKLKEFKKEIGHYICGICVKVCKGRKDV